MRRDISKKIEELLKSGTPKQKAALMCKNSELKGRGEAPLLTPEEERAILNSFPDGKGGRTYNKWLDINSRLFDYSKIVLLAYNMYRGSAQELLGFLRVWEDYIRETDRLNQLLIFMQKEAPKKVEAFKEEVLSLAYRYGKMELDDEGFFYIDIDGKNRLYDIIKYRAEDCAAYLKNFKTYIVVIEKFIKENKAEALIPILYEEIAPLARKDIAAELAPAYSRAALLRRKADGREITPDEEKRAVFPDFDSSPIDEDIEAAAISRLYNN